jgi:hypothetical protein
MAEATRMTKAVMGLTQLPTVARQAQSHLFARCRAVSNQHLSAIRDNLDPVHRHARSPKIIPLTLLSVEASHPHSTA